MIDIFTKEYTRRSYLINNVPGGQEGYLRRFKMRDVVFIVAVLIILSSQLYAVGGNMGGGDGTEATPYLIEDFADFQVFSNPNNSSIYWAEGIHTRLECDLDLDPNTTGLPVYVAAVIGNFSGAFEGNSHVISNLTIDTLSDANGANDDSNDLGLFGRVVGGLAEVRNLGLENASITGGYNSAFLGALCGYKDGGIITKCYTTGSVTGGGSSESLGGLCGKQYKGSITNCYSTCSVTGSEDIGGLCGKISYGNITDCYATGTVTGISHPDCFAGLCGFNYDGRITNCYSAGLVTWTGDFYVGRGGLCAYNAGIIEASFWDVNTSTFGNAGDNDSNSIGKTTAEMKDITTFVTAGWDFDPNDGDAMDWFMLTDDYPKLVWQLTIVYSGEPAISLAQNQTGRIQMEIFSPVDELLNWTISGHESCDWITGLAPDSGMSTGPMDKTTMTIDVDSNGLDPGEHSCNLTITADSNDTLSVPVSLHVYNRVDFEEFARLAQFWQTVDCNEGQSCSGVDWYTDGTIDGRDLKQLVISWLSEEMVYDSPEISDGFETGDLTALVWKVTGDADWTVATGSVYEGNYAAKSGVITHSQTTSLELTVETTYDTISFARRVSSENIWDYLRFYIDDVEMDKWSGEQDWLLVDYSITEGQHTFKWSYTKDGSASSGSDCGWIDAIRIYDSGQ